jgi:hypothetical protein
MGIPMVTCALCKKEITKRQSLMIDPYGRICRDHPEVEAHKEKLAQEAAAVKAKIAADKEMDESLKRASRAMNVICLVEFLRVLAYREGLPVELVFFAMRDRIPADAREEVFQEIQKKGQMTDNEVSEAIAMHLYLQSKGNM